MPIVPAIRAPCPAAHPPLHFEAPLAYADRLAGSLRLQRPRLARQRRRILTVGLPVLWLVAVLGTVSAWVTADGRRDFGNLMRDLPRFDPLPLVICLAVITAFLLVAWAAFPARMRWQMRTLMGPAGRDDPLRVQYGLERDGLSQTLPGLASFVPWALVRGLEEDRERLFVVLALAGNRLLRGRAVRALTDEITAEAPRAAAEARIGEDGIVTLQDGARARMAWSLFRGCERVGDLVILPMRWGSVLPLPLRAFDPEGLARFEALAARHLSGTIGSA